LNIPEVEVVMINRPDQAAEGGGSFHGNHTAAAHCQNAFIKACGNGFMICLSLLTKINQPTV